MPMNYYDETELPQGGSRYDSGGDPFDYTSGSLLTPWEGRFNSTGYDFGSGGGHVAPKYNKFGYSDFGFAAPDVGQFGEVYGDPAAFAETYNNPAAFAEYVQPEKFGETWQDPAAFRFADFAGPQDFQAPTAEDMRSDPGYQARMDAVKNAQMAGAAHSGVLRSGGYQKGLAKAVGDQASQEYGNVYNRRASEHDRNRQEAVSNYGINQGNTFQSFNTNTANRLQGYQTRRAGYDTDFGQGLQAYQTRRQARDTDVAQQLAGYQTRRSAYDQDIQNRQQAYTTRQGAWQGNANTALAQGELGYNVAQGTWDRNYQKARQGWTDDQQHNAQVAAAHNANSAGRAGATQAQYGRDLADYTRARDEFWTNQDRQNAITTDERNFGYNATRDYASAMMGGYGNMGDYAMGGANAKAAGTMGSANAYGNYAENLANTAGGYAMYAGMYGGNNGSGYVNRDVNNVANAGRPR